MDFSEKLCKSNCLSYALALKFSPGASTSKIELKKINGNHRNYSCIVVGQGRVVVVVVVVINTLFPSLILN